MSLRKALPSVFVLEPHPVMRAGLVSLLGSHGFPIIGSEGSLEPALDMLRAATPGLCLFEPLLDGISPEDVAQKIALAAPQAICIVCSLRDDNSFVTTMCESGAVGCLVKLSSSSEFITSLLSLLADAGSCPAGEKS